jgi:ubiquinone/menaquinone biosynthesis C-methylase UbiE
VDNKSIGNYDKIAEKYAKAVEEKPIHLYYVRPAMISLLPIELEKKHVLDLGCGTGWYTEYLLNKDCEVTSLDSNQYFVNYTNNRVNARARVICANLGQPLSMFPDNYFDLIVAPLVIHYIDNWKQLFNELARILKKKGEIVISLPQPHMTAILFNLDNYYKKCVIEDEWDKVGKVTFYHHTLHELFDCILNAGFILTALKEPYPLQELKDADPKMYKNVTTKPWFLFLRVLKQ